MKQANLTDPLAKSLGPEKTEEMLLGILESAKNWLIPFDPEVLVASGVLEKKGAWYRILKPEEFPELARKRISTTSYKILPLP